MSDQVKTAQHQSISVPDGYMEDRKGRLVPIENVDAHDIEMDNFVRDLIAKAKEQQALLRKFKKIAFEDCHAFLDLLFEKYNRKSKGVKGNVSFSTFDGRAVVSINIQNTLIFGPELQVAKELIDDCLTEWSKTANSNLQAIIVDAFDLDTEGNVNTSRILSLRKIHIENDARWDNAMNAIADSMLVASSKTYIRFKEKDGEGKLMNIPLDLAAL